MVSIKQIIAMAIVLALAVVPISISDSSDATVNFGDDPTVTGEFSDMGSGTLKVTVYNDGSSEQTITVKVVNYSNKDNILASKDVAVPAKSGDNNGTATVSLSWSYGDSGTKYVIVNLLDSEGTTISSDGPIAINVSHSIWKDTTTYVVIIIVVIVIAIGIFIKMRGLPGKKKDDDKVDDKKSAKTFTKMEEEKKNKKSGSDVSGTPAVAEKQTYDSSESKRKSKRR
jgi:hypothetical protein